MATLTLTVAASSDDALKSNLAYDDTGTTMAVGGANTTTQTNTGQGFRFINVTLQPYDIVTNLVLKLMKSGSQATQQVNRWTLEATADAATFSSGSEPGSRPIVSVIVPDDNTVSETTGIVYNFPRAGGDQVTFATALAQILATPGWVSGNAVAVINNSKQDPSQNTSSLRKNWHTWDSATVSSEPQLVIDYTAGTAPVRTGLNYYRSSNRVA